MDINIKNLADSGDIKSLKYLFVDSLDVDPTFVRYEEDYNYCKSVPGLLEKHIELTPFSNNEADWDESYWAKLKMDLIKNFSDERMSHMRKVAKTFLAEKVERILAERNKKVDVKKVEETAKINITSTPTTSSAKTYPSREEQERMLAEERMKLEREQREFEMKQEAERKRREEQRRRILEQSSQKIKSANGKGQSSTISKKAIGIAAAAVAVALTAVAIYVVLK